MKKLLLMLATAVAVVAPSTSQAIENFQEAFYVGAQGGVNFLEKDARHKIKVDFDTGYMVNGMIGYRTCQNIRLEGEIGYRHNSLDKLRAKFNGQKRKLNVNGHFETTTYMVNALYDFPTCFVVKPYAGFGIGYAHSTLTSRVPNIEGVPAEFVGRKHREKQDKFAWQAIAGLAYPLDFLACYNFDMDATLEYRYFEPNSNRFKDQTVALGLRTYF